MLSFVTIHCIFYLSVELRIIVNPQIESFSFSKKQKFIKYKFFHWTVPKCKKVEKKKTYLIIKSFRIILRSYRHWPDLLSQKKSLALSRISFFPLIVTISSICLKAFTEMFKTKGIVWIHLTTLVSFKHSRTQQYVEIFDFHSMTNSRKVLLIVNKRGCQGLLYIILLTLKLISQLYQHY